MQKKLLKRIMAMMLIFSLTFSNFALVSKSYASSITDIFFGDRSDTGNKNVSFEAYFETTENGNESSIISDVNNNELAINLSLMVENSGYLRDGQVEIKETEEGAGLNFRVKEIEEFPDTIQGLADNVLNLNQINSSEDVLNISIPIEYVNETYFDESNLSKSFVVRFSGIYVDGKGKENEVSKEQILTLSWKDEREAKIETEVEKYIDFGQGVILQTKIRLDSTVEDDEKTLPIKQTELKIEVPRYQEALPTRVDVVANSTAGTNGKGYGETTFSEKDWIYDEEEKIINVLVKNEREYIDTSSNEDEYIQEIDENSVGQLKYYNVPGIDEYLVTYTYENVEITDEEILANANIEEKITVLSGAEENNENIISNSGEAEYVLKEKTGEIVSLVTELGTPEESKAYFYANKNNEVYDIDIESKTIINVSYKDIVENIEVEDTNNSYVDKNGNTYENADIFYKSLSVDYWNFLDILGEEGIIEILDKDGYLVDTISEENDVNEEGKIIINLEDVYSKLKFKLSNPIKEGNLVIGAIKTIRGISISKDQIANLDSIESKNKISAKYNYVEDIVEVGETGISTSLEDTETMATIVLENNTLSTLEETRDFKITIELNNAREKSDLYGHSTFEIEFPEYVEEIEIAEANLYNGDGLEIGSAIAEGRKIKVTLEGTQNGINEGTYSNGTNIVLITNIKTQLFTPLTTGLIQLKTTNNEATNYNNEGIAQALVNFSSPMGVLAVKNIYNYNEEGNLLTSIKGAQDGYIKIYSEARTVTEEILIMNNTSNEISNIAILGRFPFEGVQDILTGDDLKTTITPRIIKGLTADERNEGEFKIYYSEREDADKNIEDIANGWVENPENLENIRSYLIISAQEEYTLDKEKILRFNYEYEVPGQLPHNEIIDDSFVLYYVSDLEYGRINNTEYPETTRLTTGEGPEIKLSVTTNRTEVKEYEEIEVIAELTNIGSDYVEDAEIDFPIQINGTYISHEAINGETNWIEEVVEEESAKSKYLKANADSSSMSLEEFSEGIAKTKEWPLKLISRRLDPGESMILKVEMMIDGISESYEKEKIYELPDNIPDEEIFKYSFAEDGGYIHLVSIGKQPTNISFYATATAKDFDATISSKSNDVLVSGAAIKVDEELEKANRLLKQGDEIRDYVSIINQENYDLKNVKIKKIIPEEFMYVDGYTLKRDESHANIEDYRDITGTYDENTRELTWNIESIPAKSYLNILVTYNANAINEEYVRVTSEFSTQVTADGIDLYSSIAQKAYVGRPLLTITQESASENTYIKEGDQINYIFKIKNEGTVTAQKAVLTDEMPTGVYASKVNYKTEDREVSKSISPRNKVEVETAIRPNQELIVNVTAVAASLNGSDPLQTTNIGNISATNTSSKDSNAIEVVVEPSDEAVNNTKRTPADTGNSKYAGGNSTNKYSIAGLAWLDTNRDGIRSSGETVMSGLTVRLVNNETKTIINTTTTGSDGKYTFSNLENGTYIVLIDYDTEKYKVTTFKKSDVAQNVNSDFESKQLQQAGKETTVAASEILTVLGKSVSGIDLGLVLADIFDLEIDKTITKVTTQTSKGTVTENYNNVKLAKTEIAAKNLTGATVFVEYEIKVSNVGDVKGYAKKIVDYIPEGMTFNSSLGENSKWYTGKDGNLYTEELANKELAKGQSATIKLVLTRQMSKENTDVVSNRVEIFEDYNKNGIEDINSKAGNKAQGENDLSSADIAILVKTGESLIYASVIMTTAILGIIVVFVAYTQITARRKKIIE